MYDELKFVLDYVVEEIDSYELVKLHKELSTFYEQTRTSPTPETTKNIVDKQSEIEEAQNEIEPQDWDVIKIRIFEQFGATGVLGNRGYARLVKELSQFTNDPSGASQTANRFSTEIAALKQRAESSISGLGELLGEAEELPEGKKRIQLVFDNLVSVNKLDDLEFQAGEWSVILDNFKQILPQAQEEPTIYKIYKSSPLVICIAASLPIIVIISKVAKYVLDVVQQLYDIQLTKQKIKESKIDITAKEKALEIYNQEEEKQLNKLVDEKVKELMSGYKKELDKGQANVAENAAKYILKKIYNFTIQGGNVNLVDGDVEEGEIKIEQSQLAPTYELIRKQLKSNGELLKLAAFTQKEEEVAQSIAEMPVEEKPAEVKPEPKKRGRKPKTETSTK